mgnify:CR=1 FL=1
MRLTIGMACYDDFEGVFGTVENLLSQISLPAFDAELLVVDNHPDSADGKSTAHYIRNLERFGARYIPMPEPVGTSPARDRVFHEARGEIVLCVDSHVSITRPGIEALLEYYRKNPGPHLVTGVLLSYDRGTYWTHFDPVWRGGMWGIWGTDPRGQCESAPPFEVPGQGLGLFACPKQFWPGFNPLARGFGGEEIYIHRKMAARGGRGFCLPALRFVHRFRDQSTPTPYRNDWKDRIRNYLLEFAEMGWDTEPIRRHFVDEIKAITAPEYDALAQTAFQEWAAYIGAEPSGATLSTPTTTARPGGCGCRGNPEQVRYSTLADWLAFERNNAGEITRHLAAIEEGLKGMTTVAHYGAAPPVAALALAQSPRLYLAVADNADWWPQARAVATGQMQLAKASPERVSLPTTEAVIVDLRKFPRPAADTPEALWRLLNAHQSARRIIVVGAELGAQGNVEPPPRAAIRQFTRAHSEWFVLRYDMDYPGLVILSSIEAERPKLPPRTAQVLTFARAVTQHLASGARRASPELVAARLDACAVCPSRVVEGDNQRCAVCGCYLAKGIMGLGGKAEWLDQDCPLGKWPSPAQFPNGGEAP